MSSVLETLVPAVAVILSNIQLASPLKAVLICRRLNELGSMNPVPWGVSEHFNQSLLIYASFSSTTIILFILVGFIY